MTVPVPLAAAPPDPAVPWAHLQPLLDAEATWGTYPLTPFQKDPHDPRGWTMLLRTPLHPRRLRATFDFPPSIVLLDGWKVVDTAHDIGVVGVSPEVWEQQQRSRFMKLVALVGRASGDRRYQPDTLTEDGAVPSPGDR